MKNNFAVAPPVPRSPAEQEKLKDAAMRLLSGLDIKDRKFRFRTYKQCFVGKEAVAWMIAHRVAADQAEAVTIGQNLLVDGVFHHVLKEHAFKDDYLYYRFAVHEEELGGSANTVNPVDTAAFKAQFGRTNSTGSSANSLETLEDRQFGVALASMKWANYALMIGALSPMCLKAFRANTDEHLIKETRKALLTLAALMMDDLHIKNRRLGTKFAKLCQRCIIGREVVAWLISRAIAEDEHHAIQIANLMLREKILTHITAGSPSSEKDAAVAAASASTASSVRAGSPVSAAESLLQFKPETSVYYRFSIHERGTEAVDLTAASFAGLPEDAILKLRDQVLASKLTAEGLVHLRIVAANMKREINIADRKWKLRVHARSFVGSEVVAWLISEGVVDNEKDAIKFGSTLVDAGIIQHVSNADGFENSSILFRFSKSVTASLGDLGGGDDDDDSSSTATSSSSTEEMPAWVRELSPSYVDMIAAGPGVPASTLPSAIRQSLAVAAKYLRSELGTRSRSYRFKTYKNVFFGKELVQKMIDDGVAESERHALQLCELLIMDGHISSVASESGTFRNDKIPFRFSQDSAVEVPTEDLYMNTSATLLPGLSSENSGSHTNLADLDSNSSSNNLGFGGTMTTGKDQLKAFSELLSFPLSLRAFQRFLKKDFSDEHIKFWLAVECLKVVEASAVDSFARFIYDEHIASGAPHEVNIDARVRGTVTEKMAYPSKETFDEAQKAVFYLMRKTSYPRFLESEQNAELQRTMRSQRATFAWY